jgi:uncharacterized membrane protein YhaH (DUF805 family)
MRQQRVLARRIAVGSFFGSIGRGFRMLLHFGGRDRPGQFWPYAALIVFLGLVAMFAAMIPPLFDSLARVQRFAAEHPELTTVDSGPGHYSVTIEGYHPELMPDLSAIAASVAVIAAIAILLLAAAVARRLHDRGKPGLLALLPLPFLCFAFAIMPRLFHSVASGKPDLQMFGRLFPLLFLNNLLYLASLLYLVVQLASAGTKGPNRYGEAAQTQ